MKKDFLREVRYTFARFLSILLIAVLGTAFFSGIKASAPAMRESADATYDSENFMDICIQGTLGVTEKDVEEVSKVIGVSDVEGAYTADVMCSANGAETVTSLLSLTDRINLVRVTEGRFPEKYDECIADRKFLEKTGYKLGDTVSLYSGNSNDILDTLAANSFTIVGVGNTAYYLSDDRGTAEIGSGTVDAFLVIPKEAFRLSYFTRLYVTVADAAGLNCFSSKYDRLVKQVINNIKTISDTRCDVRYAEFQSEATALINRAEDKFSEQKQKALDQLERAYKELSDAQSALDIAQNEINSKKQEIADAQEMLNMQEQNLPENKARVAEAKKSLEEIQAQYTATRSQLNANNQVISKMEEELRRAASSMTASDYADAAFTIYSYKAQSQFYQSQLDAISLAIDQGNKRIAAYEQALNGSPEAIADARAKIATGDAELQKAQRDLTEKQATLNKKKEEYELSKNEMSAEFDDAQARLDAYKQKIDATGKPKWYVNGRDVVGTFAAFDNDADGISAIGTVFPIIFFLVAALVSLTTVTRMVEEQRSQIGTLKAVGYGKKSITVKYLLYAFSATLVGSVIGVILGESIIPSIVVNTYKVVYVNLTKTAAPFNLLYALIAVAAALACTTGAAFFASRRILKQTPALLMRPEAPVSGKKILLEKFRWFWVRLSYGQKAAFRNLARYKKRLFMTLFGVAGCTALLVVGFGIRDSVSSMTEKQYNKIMNYQASVTIDTSLGRTEKRHLLSEIQTTPGVSDYLQVYRSNAVAVKGSTEKDVFIVVPQNVDYLGDYISLTSRISHESYLPDDNGVIITEKLAKLLGVSVGDTLAFKSDRDSGATVEIEIKGITENYLNHYAYMTPGVYKLLFGESAELNTLLLRCITPEPDVFSRQLMSYNGVTSVTMNSDAQQKANDTLDKLMVVVILMIVSAGLLAFVVLYNLNNINITERRRELATLKVIGFYPDELKKYVYRENFIMTFFGMLIGLAVGVVLHLFVMRSVETDMMMFGMDIKWYSFVLSIAITMLFTFIVNFLMSFKLKKIDMVESLKSIE